MCNQNQSSPKPGLTRLTRSEFSHPSQPHPNPTYTLPLTPSCGFHMAVSNSHLSLSIVTIGIIGIIYVPSTAGSPSPAVCDAGQRLQGATCLPCDPGTFMPVNSHTYTRCFQCDRVIPGSWESVLKPCTRTTDIQKICEPGVAFRFRERVCATCTICLHGEIETRPCTEHSDRECSPRTTPAPAVCDAGQHLQGDTCVPCEPGTYMSKKSHTHTQCFQCDRVLRRSWESVKEPCTRTTNIQTICEPGIAFRPRGRQCFRCLICLRGEVETRPCTEHSGRECSPRTIPAPAVCDAGHHLQGDTCVPCDPGTFMPVNSHTHTQCVQCDRVLRGSLESVKEPCTWTTDIQMICLPGVAFRFHGLCTMCTICLHDEVETRPCTEYSNRQCAPRSTNGHDTKL